MNCELTHRGLSARTYRATLFSDSSGRFATVRDANVLIYWPHGVGDWVFLSYLLPTLEPTNRYWVTRFGDDTVSLMEGNKFAAPLYTGVQSPHCNDGGLFGIRHFGLQIDQCDGNQQELSVPLSLYLALVEKQIQVVLYSSFSETWGHVPFPYHTKCRNMIRLLSPHERSNQISLATPLQSSMCFDVSPWLTRWVEARLVSAAGFGERKLCLIGRNGYTALGKNWGHLWREEMPPNKRREGEECREFMRLMLRRDPRWLFLILEDRLFSDDHTVRSVELNAVSYAELFGEVGTNVVPFGIMMKALINLADLAIGVPAGPFHLCMAKPELPTVGIWIEHFPSWYDEPKAASIHVASQNIRPACDRPGSFEQKGELEYRIIWCKSRIVQALQVLEAVEQLLD